ncbi:MAG: serine/threonine-protein kinase [Ilumatobacter sp.]|uniref:serine/threonine-protein kinase n=1 Tax=Ilumatobacter sp. TaxID=1967498 RepID=UPI0026387A05|nr:serine/threonine-protein kinase [Ilumatobacter sp.]MDJ0770895.1 serine/threonine-protein kinase [Ilumatobacter sp.]
MPSTSPSPQHAPSGQLLAERYRLERRIGQGGMAEVWVATDVDLDRKVAVKWLKTNLATDPVVAERFRREAIAVARLNHPNIVGVHDVFVDEGRQAVVMQLVDGKSLRQLLDSQKRLGPELTIHIGAAIAGALDEAHRAGFVHRDVKPGNILVTSDGRVLLTDFGIAKGLEPGDEDLTSDNVMMGTAKYLSPEQVRGRRLDGRADLYSLGLVLYECLAGRVPFLGESDADTALARLQRDPTDLGHLRPTLPIGLVNLIHKTLARNPAHRPQTGSDLRAALLAVDTSPPEIDGTPAEPPPRIANPPTKALGAGPGVPGDPHISGTVALTRRDHRPRSSTEARRDPTPPASAPIHGTPARQDEQRWTPSLLVVGALLVAALVVAAVLFVGVNRGDESDDFTTDTLVPDVAPAAGDDRAAGSDPAGDDEPGDETGDAALAAGGVQIASVQAWDPDGTNGTENDAQAGLALADGSASTAWPTECYQDRFLGGKRGVGLILGLSTASSGTLSFESLNGPFQVDVYQSDSEGAPADLDGWTQVGTTQFADDPAALDVPVETAARHLLVWLKELGPDEACSTANPYRGRLGEISFAP